MNKARTYRMTARAESTEASRSRILDAATERFLANWYDEVTLGEIARDAAVTQQTVINHFGSKEGLLEAAVARIGPERHRQGEGGGDPAERVVADYENGGDAGIRLLALEDRVPALKPFLETGRAGHRAWVEATFAEGISNSRTEREVVVSALIAPTDLYTWKLLRRDTGLSRAKTISVMRRLVAGALDPS